MNEKYKNMRIPRSYVLIALYLVFFAASLYGLIQVIQFGINPANHGAGNAGYVFLLGLSTMIFFFLTLVCIFSPYIRVDDDRIIIHHDMLRKDVVFFYDLDHCDYEDPKAITVVHLQGVTRIEFHKINPGDKALVTAFFKELEAEKALKRNVAV
ncbi:MAG: hypothetical protein ACHQRM_15555 [Bacteroidia bacterium]